MQEKKRKFFHFIALILPILYYFFLSQQQMLMVLCAAILFIVPIDIAKLKIPFVQRIIKTIFQDIIKPDEYSKLSGMSYMFMGFLATAYFFPKDITILSWLILIICDPIAALCGKKYGQQTKYGKSLAGSQAFLISGFLTCLFCNAYFGFQLGFIQVLFAIFCTSAVEFFANYLKVDDNLLIPLVFCCAATV